MPTPPRARDVTSKAVGGGEGMASRNWGGPGRLVCMSDLELDEAIARASEAVRGATAILIACGAGMGVDSGLPDFRGTEGFWRAYPAYRELGLNFAELACPRTFEV